MNKSINLGLRGLYAVDQEPSIYSDQNKVFWPYLSNWSQTLVNLYENMDDRH